MEKMTSSYSSPSHSTDGEAKDKGSGLKQLLLSFEKVEAHSSESISAYSGPPSLLC